MSLLRLLPVYVGLVIVATPVGAVTTTEGALLTSLVATAAASDNAFDVLTRDDIKNALAVESDRQALGCEESTCLAELAGAMGARVVVYGSVGRLGDGLLLTLNLFDSDKGSSGGRRVAQATDVSGLAAKIEGTTTELLQAFSKSGATTPGTKVKLLVLDLEVKDVSDAAVAAPAPAPGPPLLGVVGIGVGTLGLLGVGAGAYFDWQSVDFDARAREDGVTQKDAADLFAQSDNVANSAMLAYGIGGVVAVIGVGVAVAGFVLE